MDYRFLLSLAIILLSTKVFGLISQRVQLPSVVGALLAGLLLGPTCLNMVVETDFLLKTSELGVIFLMFLAGLDTDLKELKKTGLTSLFIAACGVVVPLIGGALCYKLFFPQATGDAMLRAVFVGVVLAATSVSITVETLRELGRLRGSQRQPLMPVVFTSGLGVEQWHEGKWLGKLNYNISQTPQVWLDHQVVEMDGCLCLFWDSVPAVRFATIM